MKPDTAATSGGRIVFRSPIIVAAVGKVLAIVVSSAALLPRSAAPLPAAVGKVLVVVVSSAALLPRSAVLMPAASKHSPSSPSA